MNVPLDRLYHYIQNIAEKIYDDRVIIYRFWPNGSKKIENLGTLEGELSFYQLATGLPITCHDQEPLSYGLVDHTQSIYPLVNLLKSSHAS